MTTEELDATLSLLRKHKVAVFKQGDLSVQFDPEALIEERIDVKGADPESIAEAERHERATQDVDPYWSSGR